MVFLSITVHNQFPATFLLDNSFKQVPVKSEIRDRLPQMDMEYDRKEHFITNDRRHQLIGQIKQFIKNTQTHKIIKINETAALIGRLNFLRTQFREASLYLMLIDSAKTRAVKTQDWTGMIVSQLEASKELYWWIKKIAENKKQQIQDLIPQTTVVTDASSQGWGATIELDSGEVLVAHGAWLSYQIHWTNNRRFVICSSLQTIAKAIILKFMARS
ncbi:MAG: hypothetical protein EZS28_042296, partial [Streblomastix strix]